MCMVPLNCLVGRDFPTMVLYLVWKVPTFAACLNCATLFGIKYITNRVMGALLKAVLVIEQC